MEIDEVFSSIEEIQAVFEKEEITWRISTDDADEINEIDIEINAGIESGKKCSKDKADDFSFSSEADAAEIEKWEAELPDIDENEALEENFDENIEECNCNQAGSSSQNYENADVLYFDTFKKKAYSKTYIFQKEIENGSAIYRLVGCCEAPMT